MDDDDLDEPIPGPPATPPKQDAGDRTDRIVRAADLAVFFTEPEPRIRARLQVLVGQRRVRESSAAPDRWMIVLEGSPDNARHG